MQLRNRQKKEWEVMKRKMDHVTEEKKKAFAQQQQIGQQERRNEDRVELMETETSKQLALAMLKSAKENSDDTLQRAVELLHNQNGNGMLIFQRKYNCQKYSKEFVFFVCICLTLIFILCILCPLNLNLNDIYRKVLFPRSYHHPETQCQDMCKCNQNACRERQNVCRESG